VPQAGLALREHFGGVLMDRSTTVGGALSLAVAFAAPAGARASDFGVCASWGSSSDGQCAPPATLGPVQQVAAGGFHSVALTAYGEVVCWGAGTAERKGLHDFGQSIVPASAHTVVQIRAGRLHTLARRSDGTVVAWGSNASGQCAVPGMLGATSDIAAGGAHSLAICVGGSVAAWGSDELAQCDVPWTLGAALAIAAGEAHSLAVRVDGRVACWGSDAAGQCGAPMWLDAVVALAAGEEHSVALRDDGTVRCWGSDAFGQSSAPDELRGVTSIAAGARCTVAALDDGSIVAWGDGASGQCAPPTNATRTLQVSAGRAHALAVACSERRVDLATGSLGPIGAGIAHERLFRGLPLAIEQARITVRARADLGAPSQFLSISLNGLHVGDVLRANAHPCPEDPDADTLVVGEDLLNLALVAGAVDGEALSNLRVRITASDGVKLDACTGGDVACCITYSGRPQACPTDHFSDPCEDTALGRDCDGNGRRDACDILEGAEDSDADGVLDSCEYARGDLNLDGTVDSVDLDEFLTLWFGQRDPHRGDLDRDGIADARDLTSLLSWWGEVDW